MDQTTAWVLAVLGAMIVTAGIYVALKQTADSIVKEEEAVLMQQAENLEENSKSRKSGEDEVIHAEEPKSPKMEEKPQ